MARDGPRRRAGPTFRRISVVSLTAQLALVAIQLASATGEIHAQDVFVRGHVLDADTEEPVTQAAVFLVEGNRVVAGPVLTDGAGAFFLEWSGSTEDLRVEVQRLGYGAYTSEELERGRSHFELEILLERDAIRLDPLDVQGTGRERGRDGFQRRRQGERGYFLDPIHVALMEAPQVTDILRRVPGFYEDFHEGIQPMTECVITFLDHMRLPVSINGTRRLFESRLAFGGAALNEVVGAREVRGVEVYRTRADVPDEIRDGFRWPSVPPDCGVILIWTTIGW